MNKIILLIFSGLIILSCSNDDDSSDSNNTNVITTAAQNILGTSATLGGSVNSTSPNFNSRGVCWGTSQNPTLQSFNFEQDELNENGSFSFQIENLVPNQTYYARAYVQRVSDSGVMYGNQIEFSTVVPVITNFTSNITTTKAILNGDIVQSDNSSSIVGFFYSTDANVNLNDTNVVAHYNLIGSDHFEIEIENLEYNRTYYVKSYIYRDGNYTLGNEASFKTTGYYGPASGYVGYDKGEYSNGWRYLEIYPNEIEFDSTTHVNYYWGEYGVWISGTQREIGFGLENTTIIINATTVANCAARGCNEFSINGFSDWFLPSIDEVVLFNDTFKKIGISLYSGGSWSSTQSDVNQAYKIDYNLSQNAWVIYESNKNWGGNVLPMRRY